MERLIQTCKDGAVMGMEQFLKSLSHVPQEKLNWSPSPTAKSPLRIAAHTAVAAGNFAKMLKERRLPAGDQLNEFISQTIASEEEITSIREAEALYRRNTEEVIAALNALTPQDVELTLDSSLGWSMPMTFLMQLPLIHGMAHASQIDYLQTCWGDQEIYFKRK